MIAFLGTVSAELNLFLAGMQRQRAMLSRDVQKCQSLSPENGRWRLTTAAEPIKHTLQSCGRCNGRIALSKEHLGDTWAGSHR
mmetsp:Transcript_14094/g.36483  ORF Transcript_14094/g.36483 Transcript_14094/m.36483 type:complete len:83 (-) Transcript_14094:29-277(-)